MIRMVLAALLAGGAVVAPGLAQNPPPPSPPSATPEGEDGRYMYHRVQDGFVRLDTRTGQVSFCTRRPAGWTCHAVPDERNALEAEISRLQTENAVLKKELLSRGLDLPQGMTAAPPAARERQPDLRLPSDADLERAMAFLEKAWRRLVEMIMNLQRDLLKGG